ncbi:hypothetical protein W59_12696 [Rhodococcus opacus RKJ300 = JCM 13270]|jgi:hypothetical protein|uniref:Uncharacterized protein n=1 Tax=Rhodococcus opacus RKJ300 = JCM 13270 TaxID=1165867 RepID=I0WT10_RHOOP|nr:hypothetical protein W59_12696 [Rhodococcus opacus RKJ300 = JCM 13270]
MPVTRRRILGVVVRGRTGRVGGVHEPVIRSHNRVKGRSMEVDDATSGSGPGTGAVVATSALEPQPADAGR